MLKLRSILVRLSRFKFFSPTIDEMLLFLRFSSETDANMFLYNLFSLNEVSIFLYIATSALYKLVSAMPVSLFGINAPKVFDSVSILAVSTHSCVRSTSHCFVISQLA